MGVFRVGCITTQSVGLALPKVLNQLLYQNFIPSPSIDLTLPNNKVNIPGMRLAVPNLRLSSRSQTEFGSVDETDMSHAPYGFPNTIWEPVKNYSIQYERFVVGWEHPTIMVDFIHPTSPSHDYTRSPDRECALTKGRKCPWGAY